mgnify:CR=1 FL=1
MACFDSFYTQTQTTNIERGTNERKQTTPDLRGKSLISGKNIGEQIFPLRDKTKYNHRMIEADVVWMYSETTISAKSTKP